MKTAHEHTPMAPATPERKAPRKSGASEVWDDDFVFQLGEGQGSPSRQRKTRFGASASGLDTIVDDFNDVEAGPSRATSPVKAKSTGMPDALRAWSESPTSPRVRRAQHEENWDEDFLDRTDSPVRPSGAGRRNGRHAHVAQPRALIDDADQENWDEDFDVGSLKGASGAAALVKRARGEPAWETSDSESDADFDREMGFDRDEEDRTVTARSRRRPLGVIDNNNDASRPPLPPLPTTYLPTIPSGDVPEPFPRSPTHSVFSIPATTTSAGGRDSVSGTYGSTAHLRRTHSAESSSPVHQSLAHRFPPSSPPRERRRLRKKSRPPHLDSSILEQDDRPPPPEPVFRPITPESRPKTPPPPPPAASSAVLSPATPSSSAIPPTSPSSKSPLLTRIGSMKRWGVAGVRRKRAATAPSENQNEQLPAINASAQASPPTAFRALEEEDRVDHNRTPRPHSYISSSPPAAPTSPTKSQGRFFRGSTTAGLVSDDAPAPQEQLTLDARMITHSQSNEWKRESLRLIVPESEVEPSRAGDKDLAASPRKARMRAFGHRLLPGKSTGAVPEARVGKRKSVAELSVEELNAHLASMPRTPPRHPLPLSPLAGDTPTRLRPRIPHQAPASLRARPIFPRHVSGSAVHDAHPPLPPDMSARSVSASAAGESSDELALSVSNSDRLSVSTGNSHSHSAHEKEKGHRSFMGSIRRMSLVSAQRRHKRGKSAEPRDASDPQSSSASASVPPLPSIPVDLSPLSSTLLSPSGILHRQTSGQMTLSEIASSGGNKPRIATAVPVSLSAPVDLSSPTTGSFLREQEHDRARPPTLAHSKSSSFATAGDGSPQSHASPISRLTMSSQAASLGRASPLPMSTGNGGSPGTNVYRRNSLGDLKIPTRISRAQDGLKRDLGRVREFASHVEQMIGLRSDYFSLAAQIQTIVDTSLTNPLSLSRSSSRARSKTNPSPTTVDLRTLGNSFQAIDRKYAVAWECADLLIELGTGGTSPDPPQSVQSPPLGNDSPGSMSNRQKNRERAVTLGGDEGKPDFTAMEDNTTSSPTSTSKAGGPSEILAWRASTGRHDLGHRQLYLLKEMLNSAEYAREGSFPGAPDMQPMPGFNTSGLGWEEGMESTLTLPSEESNGANVTSPMKSRRYSRIVGMTGIRDMLRMLTRSQALANARTAASAQQHAAEAAQSRTTLSTESSFDAHGHAYTVGPSMAMGSTRRRGTDPTTRTDAKNSFSPAADFNPYAAGNQIVPHKCSPRRPSLASLFRIGQKHKASPASSAEQSRERSSDGPQVLAVRRSEEGDGDDIDDESDSEWDRMDSTSDIDAQLQAINGDEQGRGTLKLRKKKRQSNPLPQPQRSKTAFNISQTSILTPDQSAARLPRLSNVDENNASTSASGSGRQTPATPESSRRRGRSADPSRAGTGAGTFASVRSVPAPPRGSPKGIPAFDQPAPSATGAVTDLKLAMTPDNIRPLLENARVVNMRLNECLREARTLLNSAELLVASRETMKGETANEGHGQDVSRN